MGCMHHCTKQDASLGNTKEKGTRVNAKATSVMYLQMKRVSIRGLACFLCFGCLGFTRSNQACPTDIPTYPYALTSFLPPGKCRLPSQTASAQRLSNASSTCISVCGQNGSNSWLTFGVISISTYSATPGSDLSRLSTPILTRIELNGDAEPLFDVGRCAHYPPARHLPRARGRANTVADDIIKSAARPMHLARSTLCS